MSIEINGLNITPNMKSVLQRWQKYQECVDGSIPMHHIECLGDIQDFLCRILNDYPKIDTTIIANMLIGIINIKDDLKFFVTEERSNHE